MNALEIAEAALAHAEGEAEAVVQAERSGLARFAASEIHQPTLIDNTTVQLGVLRDGRLGIASTNRLDDESLAALARRAGEAAESTTPDETVPPFGAPASYPEVDGCDEATAALGSDEQARIAAAAIAAAGDFPVYGYFTSGAVELAIATTHGLRAAQRVTDATLLVLASAEDASGWATQTSWRAADLDPAAVVGRASEKAARTHGAGELEPGRYAAVLEPAAVADAIRTFGFSAFNGLGVIEGRSYLAGRLGERVFDEKVSIADDPLDPRGLPKTFDFEGTPKRRVELVEGGVARSVTWDRRLAGLAGDGTESTGNALPAMYRQYGAIPDSLTIAPGEAESLDELAELVGEGIYVTRLHYLGIVDPRAGVLTGMTRDGTFRIAGGKVAEPLVNLRFTISVPDLLADVPGLTRKLELVNSSDFYGDRYATASLVPALATRAFTITGIGSRPGL